jgi:hypothetical protein
MLTASCLPGAVDPPSGCACAAGQQPGVVYYDNTPSGLRARLRTVLGLRPASSPYPVLYAPQPAVAQQQTLPPPETAQPATQLPAVAEKHQDKIGHEDDYSWITGQLYYVRADGGRWVLRYGRIDEVDRFGGSVVLAPTVEMRNFREGDVVCVFGQVMSDGPATRALGGPLYRANSISMVERSDP